MGFQNPLALWGLALLAVPLYIHFFGFRLRRKAYFTRLDWLLQQQIPVQQRERLFRYLLLATRILAIIMLVGALAGPMPTSISPHSLNGAGSRCMIYVDNSRGMAMEGSGGPLLEQAKSSARRLIQNAKSDTRFVLMSNLSRPLHGGWLHKDRALDLLDQIQVSNQNKSLSSVVLQMDQRLEQEGLGSEKEVSLWLLSDFKKGSMEGSYWRTRSKMMANNSSFGPLNLIPCRPMTAFNAAIDSAWLMEPFFRPGIRNRMVVRTRTYGEWPQGLNISLELLMAGQRKSLATLQGPESANSVSSLRLDTLDFTVPKDALGLVELLINDPYFAYDNRYFFSNSVQNTVSVLHGSGARHNSFLRSVWATDTLFEVQYSRLQDWARINLDSFSLVLLEISEPLQAGHAAALANWVRNGGGHLFLLPADEESGESLSKLSQVFGPSLKAAPWRKAKARLANLDVGNDFLGTVLARKPEAAAMPTVEGYFPWQLQAGDEVLLKLESGEAILKRMAFGQGMVYALAVPAEQRYTEWVRHDLFLPVFYRTALGSVRSTNLTGSMGGQASWSLPLLESDAGSLDWILQAKELDDQGKASKTNGTPSLGESDEEARATIRPEIRVVNGRAWIRLYNTEVKQGFYALIRQGGEQSNTYLAINSDPKESDIVPMSDKELLAIDPNFRLALGNRPDLQQGFQQGFLAGDGLMRLFLVACLVFLGLEAVLLWQRKA
ncbi:MAG: hypothetical protein FJ338_00385 [Sphingomonadales bacterium]|nr:hypothetical protein [Sphingomonadales bacterium]